MSPHPLPVARHQISIREPNDERKRHIGPRHLGSSKTADLPSDAFPADCDRFAGHYLRSRAQPGFRDSGLEANRRSVFFCRSGGGPIEHSVEQHVTAGGEVVGLGVFDLVVADAADTGHEDHRGRGDARQIDRVVPGAADDVLMPVGLCLGGIADRGHEVGIERGRREMPELVDLGFETDRCGGGFAGLPQLAVHCAQHPVIRMAEIDGEENASRDRVA